MAQIGLGTDDEYIQSLLAEIEARFPSQKRSLWQKVTQPVKTLFGATGGIGGKLAGVFAPDLYDEALQKNLEGISTSRGTNAAGLSDAEKIEALPGLGQVITQADIFQDNTVGRTVAPVLGLVGDIAGDPTSYLGGAGALSKIAAVKKLAAGTAAAETLEILTKAGVREGSFTGRALESAGAALAGGNKGRATLETAKAVVPSLPFGAAAGLVYAPEMYQGITQPLGQIPQDIREGKPGQAVEHLAQSALTATMTGLVARGIMRDAEAARLIRDFHAPIKSPQEAAAVVAQEHPEVVPPAPLEAPAAPLGTPQDISGAFPRQAPTGFTRQAPTVLPEPTRGEGFPTGEVRSQPGGAQEATLAPSVISTQGGVPVDAKLGGDVVPEPQALTPAPTPLPTPVAQDALPAAPAPTGASLQPPAAIEAPVLDTLPPEAPQPIAALQGMDAGDFSAYQQAKGTGKETSQDTYRGRNKAGEAAGLKLSDKAARRVSGAVKSAKEALKNGSGEGLPPLARAIYDDLSEAPAETQVAPGPQRAEQRGAATQPVEASPESGSMRVTVPRASDSLEVQRLSAELNASMAQETPPVREAPPVETPAQAAPQIAPEPSGADIRGKVGSQVLGAQTPSERAKTLPQAEESQAAATATSAEKQGQWAMETKSRGTSLAPEELAAATESQKKAISALHGESVGAGGEISRTSPTDAPLQSLLARARRSISDKRVGEEALPEIQAALEKRLLAMSEKKDVIQDWISQHPGNTPAQAVRGLLSGKVFSDIIKGRVRSKVAKRVGAFPEIGEAIEGASPEARARFLQDHRIDENVLASSADGITGAYDLLDRVVRKVQIDGKPAEQWMVDGAIELGPPPSGTLRGDAAIRSYNERLTALLDAAGVKVDLSRAKAALKRMADGIAKELDLERGQRTRRSMTSSPQDVAEQKAIMARAEEVLGDLTNPDRTTLEALADLAQVSSRTATITNQAERNRVRKQLDLNVDFETLGDSTGAKWATSASDSDKARAIADAIQPGGAKALDDILKSREAGDKLAHRALTAKTTDLPYSSGKWEGLIPNPTDKNQFRFGDGKANLYGRVIRHTTDDPWSLAVMPDDAKGHQSAKSIPALEALAAEAGKHGQRELYVNWDWFGTNRERYTALLEADPNSPVRLSELPSRDPEYLRLGIDEQEPPPRPSGPAPGILGRLEGAAEAARARLDQRGAEVQAAIQKGGSQAGVSANIAADIADYAIIAAHKIATQGVKFAEWVKELPEHLKLHAKEIWARAQTHVQVQEGRKEATTGRTVEAPVVSGPAPEVVKEAVARRATEAVPVPARKAIKPIPMDVEQAARNIAEGKPVPKEGAKPGAAPPQEESFYNTHRNVIKGAAKDDAVKLGRELYPHLDRNKKESWTKVAREAFAGLGRDDPEEFIARIQKVGAQSTVDTVKLRAIANHHYLAMNKAKEAAETALASGDKARYADAQQQYIEQVYKTATVAAAAANDATSVARQLRVRGMMLGAADPAGLQLGRLRAGLERMLKEEGNKPADAREAALLLSGEFEKGNYDGILKAIREVNSKTAGDMLVEAFKANLIGAPSVAAAGLSNTLFEGLRYPERALGAGLDRLLTAAGVQSERQFVQPSMRLMAHAKGNAVREGWHQLSKDLFALAKGQGLELRPEDFLSAAETDFKNVQGAIPGRLGNYIRTSLTAMNVMDRLAKTQAKHTESMYQAVTKAWKDGARGEALNKQALEHYQELVGAAMDMHHEGHGKALSKWKDAVKSIYDEMDTDTFQAPLGDGILGNLSKLLGKHKWTTAIVPFKTTPMNVFLETVRRTPLGFLTAASRAKASGTPLGKELAKPIIGTAVMSMLYSLADEGGITGSGPLDPEQKAALQETGWLPYSFKLGDQYIAYQRLEPISSLLGIAADAAEGMRRGDFSSVGASLERGSQIVAENLTNKTFLQGIEGFFSAYSDPSRYGERFLKGLVGSAVPNSIALIPLGTAARAIDPTYRQTTLLNAAQAKVPFLSEELPAQTTSTGEVRQRPGSILERLLSPFARSEAKKTASARVAAEMDRIGFPIRPPRRFENIGGLRVEYTREEYEKLRAAQMAATERMAMVLKDPTYLRLPDNELDPRYRLNSTTKEDVLKRVYNRFLRPVKASIAPRLDKQAKALIRQRRAQVPVEAGYGG